MEADTPAFGDESDATVVMEYSEGEDSLVVVASDNNGGDRGGNDSRLEGVVVGNTRDEVDDVGNGQDEGVDVRDGRASIGGEVEDVPSMSVSRDMMENSTCAASGMHSSSPLQPPHRTRELHLPESPT
ncbi:hypothetical protein PF002_g2226 [Phytophthora fragariae]|uniref:Uncharacterized protein n=1 Tax=Phytophthora fragariae TaxID=53985 RepID=A0A6A4AGB3_9STRA|nr:hypothetical protein PF002_g2226 [Phytophthora fragariae]